MGAIGALSKSLARNRFLHFLKETRILVGLHRYLCLTLLLRLLLLEDALVLRCRKGLVENFADRNRLYFVELSQFGA